VREQVSEIPQALLMQFTDKRISRKRRLAARSKPCRLFGRLSQKRRGSERMGMRQDDVAGWPLRPWMFAAICSAAGLAFHLLLEPTPLEPWRQALASFVAIATLSFIFTVERKRLHWALIFAAGWGAVIALVGWFTAQYNFNPTIFEWPYLAGIFAVLLAAPLFQTVRDEGAWRFPYERLHRHAWTDAVIGAASFAFTGVTWLLAWLIAGLFDLIGIDAVKELLQESWFGWMLAGFAFGAAVGLLRERDALLGTLQRLVMIVFSVLAPVLAAALVLFLASLPFTGLDKLWASGVPTTPLLLVAGAGAIVLANAVIGNGLEEESRSRLLNWSALALVACVLPLSVIAAVSMGIRIDQYGWTPERIWGVIAVAVAIAYGIAGWWSVFRGREQLDDRLRPLQTSLAIGLCAVALFLALPILDFGAISARSQLARLQSGQVAADEFDWRAMAFNFGPAGRAALKQAVREGPQERRRLAQAALAAKSYWDAAPETLAAGPPPTELSVVPATAPVPPDLRALLLRGEKGTKAFCSDGGACRVYPQPGGATFVVIMDGCANLPPERRDKPKVRCTRTPGVFEHKDGKWVNVYESAMPSIIPKPVDDGAESLRRESEALDRGDVRIEPVEKRQLVIGGKPAGDVF